MTEFPEWCVDDESRRKHIEYLEARGHYEMLVRSFEIQKRMRRIKEGKE